MKRFLWISALIICCVCIAVFAQTPMTAKAENIDVTVSLNGDSLVSAYGEDFAYTNGKTVYVAKNNKVLSYHDTADFDRFISMAMNSTHIVLLAKKGTETLIFVYSYSNGGISKVPYINDELRNILSLYSDENGNLYALNKNFVIKFSINDSSTSTLFTSMAGLFDSTQEFAVIEETNNVVLYALINGNLYAVTKQIMYDDETSLDNYRITSDKNFKDLTISNGKLICIDETCAYSYNSNNDFTVLLENGVGNHSVICATYDSINSRHCVYVKSDIFAVNVYEYDGELNYYSSFDKTQFTHPTEYDSIALYKTTAEVTLYSSPRHLQKLALLPSNEYVLILCESGNFYYAYTYDATLSKAVYGYIKKQASISLCPAQTDTALGLYAQPLHPNTPIYEYPIDDRETKILRYASIRDQLVVIDNVGQDGAFNWGWYKVGCIDTDGNLVYGYVKQLTVSPYTSLSAPDLSKTAKLGAKKLGEYVKIYALPQEDSQVVAEVAEGSQIYLKNKFDKNSEWTQIIYEEKIAYVKTENVSPSGLTSWQLALAITLPAVAVAIAATIAILVVVKKKKTALKN